MQVSRGKKVTAACDMGDALARVVHHHGQVVAGRCVLAHDHGIAPALGMGGDDSWAAVGGRAR